MNFNPFLSKRRSISQPLASLAVQGFSPYTLLIIFSLHTYTHLRVQYVECWSLVTVMSPRQEIYTNRAVKPIVSGVFQAKSMHTLLTCTYHDGFRDQKGDDYWCWMEGCLHGHHTQMQTRKPSLAQVLLSSLPLTLVNKSFVLVKHFDLRLTFSLFFTQITSFICLYKIIHNYIRTQRFACPE